MYIILLVSSLKLSDVITKGEPCSVQYHYKVRDLQSGTKPLEKLYKTHTGIFNLNVGKQCVKTVRHPPPLELVVIFH